MILVDHPRFENIVEKCGKLQLNINKKKKIKMSKYILRKFFKAFLPPQNVFIFFQTYQPHIKHSNLKLMHNY